MTTTLRISAIMGILLVPISAAMADQTLFSNSGGTVTMGSDLIVSGSSVSSPAGSLSVDCPLTSITPTKPYTAEWSCAGGSMSLQSNDGSTSLSAAFTSGLFTEQVIPAGHGNPTTYLYVFSGYYRGTLTRGTAQEAVAGEALQTLAPATSPLGTGTIQ